MLLTADNSILVSHGKKPLRISIVCVTIFGKGCMVYICEWGKYLEVSFAEDA